MLCGFELYSRWVPLTYTLQKPFLQNFHVVIKMHLPLPLEYKVMVSSIKRETTLLLHDTGKNKLKVFTWKTITPPFSKILLVARFTLLWRHDGQAHRTAALTSLWLPPASDAERCFLPSPLTFELFYRITFTPIRLKVSNCDHVGRHVKKCPKTHIILSKTNSSLKFIALRAIMTGSHRSSP